MNLKETIEKILEKSEQQELLELQDQGVERADALTLTQTYIMALCQGKSS